MRTDTKARPVEPTCSLNTFMHALGHQPAPALPSIPQTLRSHIGARQFGDFGTVLMAERPASFDLPKRVERWRGIDMAREDLPLRAHPDQTAEDRRFNVIFVATPIAIMILVIVGLVAAWSKGAL
jgi:hypothetical protein